MPRGLKPGLLAGLIVRAKALTYLRRNGKGEIRRFWLRQNDER